MLCWFDEPPTLLRQAVKSAAVICDRLVAADGAFWLVPDRRAKSPKAQRAAIIRQAAESHIEVEFLKPRIYEGQVTKRDAVLQRAMVGSDWVMTLDADWVIQGKRKQIRAELETMLADQVDQVVVNFVTPDDASRGWAEKAANEWHIRQAGTYQELAFIYRVQPEMHYGKNHWSLYAVRADGKKLGLFGATGTYLHEQPKTAKLQAEHTFAHMCLFREQKQVVRNRGYIYKRDMEAERVGFET